jgi:glycosyltransferase involved in cell wall biosynthesis
MTCRHGRSGGDRRASRPRLLRPSRRSRLIRAEDPHALTTVLLVHNRYQEPGGEDVAVEADAALLERAGHRVVRYERDNAEILGASRIAVAAGTIWSPRSRREVDELLTRVHPDVVHAHNTFPLVSPAVFAAARARGIPVVQTLHNYRLVCAAAVLARDGAPCHACLHASVPAPAVIHACYRQSRIQSGVVAAYQMVHGAAHTWSRLVTRSVAVSRHLADVLVGAGAIAADRVDVRPNFCEPDPAPRHRRDDRGGFVFAGRITREKGIETVLRAAAMVPEARLAVVGDGPAMALARRLAPSNVTFLGRVERARALDAMAQARGVVYASVSEEPLPTVLVEAAALGVPAIATAVGGAPEVVTTATGTLVPPGDADGLATAFRDALDHPEGWAQRGAAARKRYDAEFSSGRALDRLLETYRRAGVNL